MGAQKSAEGRRVVAATRAFANDEDLNEQASRWLEGTANVRRHGTTGERPVDRFERDEREVLRPVANRPYRRLGVQPAGACPTPSRWSAARCGSTRRRRDDGDRE